MTYSVTSYGLVCHYLKIAIEYAYESSDDGVSKISARMR